MNILKDAVDKTKKKAAEMIDNAKEAAQKKAEEDRKRREEKERQFKKTFPYNHMLIINKKKDISLIDTSLWMNTRDGSFIVSDGNNKPVFIAQEGFGVNDYKYRVFNQKKELVGTVRKHMINFGFPFVKERHGCTVKVEATKKKFCFTTYLSFGERKFGGTGTIVDTRPYTLTGVGKSKYPTEFNIKKGRKNFMHVYKISSDDGFFSNRYVVGYDDENDEILAMLCGVAVRLIM